MLQYCLHNVTIISYTSKWHVIGFHCHPTLYSKNTAHQHVFCTASAFCYHNSIFTIPWTAAKLLYHIAEVSTPPYWLQRSQ